jgi:ethanolamine permease
MELGRARLLPPILGRVHATTRTPIVALIANLVFGIAAILAGTTDAIITLSCFGALALYVISMIALFVLRKKEPDLPRPFRAIAYPVFPLVALVIAAISLIALIVLNPWIAAIFFAMLLAGSIYYFAFARRLAAQDRSQNQGGI